MRSVALAPASFPRTFTSDIAVRTEFGGTRGHHISVGNLQGRIASFADVFRIGLLTDYLPEAVYGVSVKNFRCLRFRASSVTQSMVPIENSRDSTTRPATVGFGENFQPRASHMDETAQTANFFGLAALWPSLPQVPRLCWVYQSLRLPLQGKRVLHIPGCPFSPRSDG